LRGLIELRTSLLPALSRVGGRRYEGGTITSENLWTDNLPAAPAVARLRAWPGGYEIRQWATTRDDVVGDALLYPGPGAARRAFEMAASSTCRRLGRELATSSPPHARNLIWMNPDNVIQEDVLLLRGRRIYRISDVRPGQRATSPSGRDERVGLSIVNSLACSLPLAGCARNGL
jgi:hypothetical protein